MLITIGTGLGSAIFVNGQLHPNTELGRYLKMKGRIAEHYCSGCSMAAGRSKLASGARRFNRYLQTSEFLFNPDLFILGGGTAQRFDRFIEELHCAPLWYRPRV